MPAKIPARRAAKPLEHNRAFPSHSGRVESIVSGDNSDTFSIRTHIVGKRQESSTDLREMFADRSRLAKQADD